MIAEQVGMTFQALLGFLAAMVKMFLPDLLMFGGMAAVVWGVHFYSHPAAWITAGILAVVIGIFGSGRKS